MPKHEQVEISLCGQTAEVDEGIAQDILTLWHNGFRTVYSCQGEDDGTGCRYITCEGKLQWGRIDHAAELLGWVDHAVVNQLLGRKGWYTSFYRRSIERPVELTNLDAIYLFPRK